MSDIYVVVHLETTWDAPSHQSHSARHTPSELRSLSWCIVDADSLEQSAPQSLHVGVSDDGDSPALSFKEAICAFDESISKAVAQKDFSFVTTDMHNLRVALPREARDRQVVLPVYLQHPRVFDLFNEYSKWQSTHPEAMSYPSSYLSNLVTALAVDVPEDWASKDSKVPLVDIHAKILAQLARKSLPVEEHPTVLTKPYDTAHDAKVFLAERSKILYLSNLPADTTQSELESWFTSYGGRPIAFWTLKNVDSDSKAQNKTKGICGFAVFAKHEEAAQSLFMNGRLLNDRVVEVQASSTRVLDKAADLLTPFPSSKNRPRPGDWTCPSCGFSNFQRRIACFRCSFPATSAVVIQEQMFPSGVDSTNPQSQPRRLKHDDKQASAAYGTFNDYYMGSHMKAGAYNTYGGPYNHGHMNMNGNGVNGGGAGTVVIVLITATVCHSEQVTGSAQMRTVTAAAAAAAAGSIHSVNTTAAAIAAATASGQPLNLSNSFMGLQQPQPHSSRQGLHGSQSSSSSPVHAGGLYSNISQLQQLQYPQKQGHSDHNTEQMGQGVAHLPQHLAFLQTQSVSPQMLSQHRQRSNSSGEAHNPYAHGSSMPMKGVHTDDSLLNGGGINLLGKQMGSMTLNDQ
ncbi:hypothetical protein CAJCM15448_32320 [Candidozyma auris]|nr:hypothetical protein CAJCM15448_32320 [[Candida] auris]